MKRMMSALLAGLLICLVSVAAAGIPGHTTTLLCLSEECRRAYTTHVCKGETTWSEVVECPDSIANCVCTAIITNHEYECEFCRSCRIIPEIVYRHSK